MPVRSFSAEIAAFRADRERERGRAAQRVALLAACGVDLEAAERSGGEERAMLRRRLTLRIERERLRGVRGHWSYDLNRHIALKQALDSLGRA